MKQTNKLLPELRFPEFLEDGDWEIKTVSEVAYYENGKAHEQDIVINGKYKVVNSKFISTDGEVVKYTNEALCLANKNDTLMVLSDVPNGKAIAKCFYVDKNNVYTVNQRICKLTPFEINGKILYYLLNRNPYFLAFDDGVKQTNLKNDDVLNCAIALPKKTKNHKEQQKIADCLTSLDEVITAHNDKLETLKNHRKGLLQNLFPQEGQKVPNYRFSEFSNSGEWKDFTVEELIDKDIIYAPKDGNHGNIHPKSSDYVKEGIPFIMASDINNGRINFKKCAFLKKEQADSLQKGFSNFGDVLITHKGTVGEVAINNAKEYPYIMLTPQVTYYRIKNEKRLCNEFLAVFFISNSFQEQLSNLSGGGTRAYIGITEQKKLIIKKTDDIREQQKIADCLLAVDNLITAQTEKIEQLKAHKKGLMQGLFPKVNIYK